MRYEAAVGEDTTRRYCNRCGTAHTGATPCLRPTYARLGRADHTVTLTTFAGIPYVAASLGCTCG